MANKLELTWVGKEKKIVVEPRILIADPEKSHHAQGTLFDQAADDNMLIHGDNLLPLKALEARFAEQVKVHLYRSTVQYGICVRTLRR